MVKKGRKKRKERREQRKAKRRNAGGASDVVPAPRRHARRAASGTAGTFKHVLAGLGGGALGALAGGLAVKSGADPNTVSLFVLAGGALGVATLPGAARTLALGFGGFGAGQLALGFLADKPEAKANAEEPPPKDEKKEDKKDEKRSNAALPPPRGLDARTAFTEARRRELIEALDDDDE